MRLVTRVLLTSQFQAYDGAKREAGDDNLSCAWLIEEKIIKSRARIVDLALAFIVDPGTFSDSAKIDPNGLESRLLECLRGPIHNLVVHRSTE